MDILSIAISFILAALMLYLAVRLPLAILGNLQRGHEFRASLAGALDELRLSRMLGFLGIDREKYLHTNRALTIKQHMARCESCDAQGECDQTLQDSPQVDQIDSIGFCANIDDLKDIRRDQ